MKLKLFSGGIRRSEFIRCVAACALFPALPYSAVLGEEAKPSPLEVMEQLTRAYAKLDGFKATYRSVGEGKTLECTLGMDENSGLVAVHVVVKKGDQEMVMRHWNNSRDQLFTAGGEELFVFKGAQAELKSLADLVNNLSVKPDVAGEENTLQGTPSILLEKTTFGASLSFVDRDIPSWAASVKDAPIRESDEKTVTFFTEKFGLLTISRENGMLLRQSVTADDGEVRVLELRDIQLNPGKATIAEISADWSTTGAKEKPLVAMMAPLRLMSFQLIIDATEQGQADIRALGEQLEKQYEALRHFARACINESEGSFASKADWPGLFDKTKTRLHLKWLQDVPGAAAADEEGFLKYLQKPEVRLEVRDALVAGMMGAKKGPEWITDEIFGRGGWASLKVGNDQGVAAKQSLIKALSRAYLEALIDLKMEKQWDQRDGLD